MDTGELLRLGNGLLYHTDIVAVKRGEKGDPGELTGIIEYKPEQVSGVIVDNTVEGIYGVANSNIIEELAESTEKLPVALKQEVNLGDAQILCTIDGTAKYYDVQLTKLNPSEETVNRQISLTVTDPELLELTGGDCARNERCANYPGWQICWRCNTRTGTGRSEGVWDIY